ncbi:DUF1488 family protein [Paraburkholderia sp.]|uniref:DUF1488 family protein n=1 Tax=Paraburkholderia sp. TaxID=1926495 RepID=UPI0023A24EA0|nr:DUF1488 family protein [Paraburkholderia sp.]MDE1180961.1 DUF1488 family protein [Paraburkholderia sp.]
MLAMKGRLGFFAEGRLITFTLIAQGRAIACAVTRDALERHILFRREPDDSMLVKAFENARKRILAVAEEKLHSLRGARVLVTAADLGNL